MNTLRRVTRHMVKAVAAGAVLVAAGLPVAMAGTAGAATSPTITAVSNSSGNGVLPVAAQGNSVTVLITGANFANDNGSVTGTTNAPGATVSIVESSTTAATATVSTSSSTTPGYYNITLTDDNGTATFSPAFGVDPAGSSATAVSPSTVPQGTVTLMTVTGSNLSSGSVSISPASSGATAGSFSASSSGTSGTFYLNAMAANAGGVTATLPGGATVAITVTGATITSIAPAGGLLMPQTGSTSTQIVTISGSGFLSTATVSVSACSGGAYPPAGVTAGTPVIVNNTTIQIPYTIVQSLASADAAAQWTVSVKNPTGTASTVPCGIGFLMPGAPVPSSVPSLTPVSGQTLNPGWNTVSVLPSAGFPLSTGATVTLTYSTFSFSGTVIGFNGAGDALIAVYLPAYVSTTLSAASTTSAATISVASASGITTGTKLTFADSTFEAATVSSVSGTTVTLNANPANAHAAGTVVEFPLSGVGASGWTLTVNNGSTSQVLGGYAIAALSTPDTVSFLNTGGAQSTLTLPITLAPGTYTYYVQTNGANFTTGTKVAFLDSTGKNSANLSGTVVATGQDTVTVQVTVPATSSSTLTGVATLAANANVNDNAITINAATSSIAAGTVLTLAASGTGSLVETVTVASSYTTGSVTVPITTPIKYFHASGAAVSTSGASQVTGANYTMYLTNAAGVAYPVSFSGSSTAYFATTAASTVALSGVTKVNGLTGVVGAGASGASIVISGTFSDLNPLDYVVSSSTAGVSFGAVTNVTASTLTATISVAAGTAVNTNVQYTVTDIKGLGSASVPNTTVTNSGLAIDAAPVATSLSSIGTLLNGESATFSVTGTGFVNGTTVSFGDTGSQGGTAMNGVSVAGCVYTSATLLSTCVVTVGPGAMNGVHGLTVSNPDGGTSTLANALTVSAPTIGAIAPTTQATTYTLSGLTGFTVGQTTATNPLAIFTLVNPVTGFVAQVTGQPTVYAGPASVTVATNATVSNWFTSGLYAGDMVYVTLTQSLAAFGGTVFADAPAIPVGNPLRARPTGLNIIQGQSGVLTVLSADLPSSSVPPVSELPNYVFMAGATVTAVDASGNPVAGITVSNVTILPGYVTATVAVAGSVPTNTYYLQITNPDGGTALSSFGVLAGPSISAVNGVAVTTGPVSFLEGSQSTLTISGGHFAIGAVVSASNNVATFGAASVNAAGDTLTVTATFLSFTGTTPTTGDLIVTNPSNGGSAVATNEIQINPQPAVTGGPYYVPTFTTNTQMVMTGTGFQAGMKVTSSNADYTVSIANVSPTAVTLLVSTNSNATSGTSTTLTFTNPDGGTTTATLNGGPVPTPGIKAIKVATAVWTGKRTLTKIIGSGFYGQPTIKSNVGGTSVGVLTDNGTVLGIAVTVAKTAPRGVHTFTLTFKNGEVVTVRYNQR